MTLNARIAYTQTATRVTLRKADADISTLYHHIPSYIRVNGRTVSGQTIVATKYDSNETEYIFYPTGKNAALLAAVA